jgi:hypothetical protein
MRCVKVGRLEEGMGGGGVITGGLIFLLEHS